MSAASTAAAVASRAGRYSVQLDSWRAISLIGMLYTHYWDIQAPSGAIGVRMFFVISGFLITGILLRENRKRAEGHGLGALMKAFYMRRILRIVPALYLVLLVATLCGVEGLASTLPWHLLFVSNILFTIHGAFLPWSAAHLWTISVEEQFYLFWPWAVLFLSPRRLVWLIVAMAIVALCGRIGMMIAHQDGARLLAPTPLSFDALGAGAMLALAVESGWLTAARVRVLNIGAAVIIPVMAVTLFLPLPVWFGYVVSQALLLVPMVALVWASVRGVSGLPGWLLSLPPLVYLGRISYAVYLYHYFLLAAYYQWGDRIGLPLYPEGGRRFLLLSATTIALGAASWHWIERPFMALKGRFDYVPVRRDGSDPPEG